MFGGLTLNTAHKNLKGMERGGGIFFDISDIFDISNSNFQLSLSLQPLQTVLWLYRCFKESEMCTA